MKKSVFVVFYIFYSVLYADETSVSLIDVVNISLSKNPNIQLRQYDIQNAEGSLQEAKTKFIGQTNVFLSRSREYTPLGEASKPAYENGKVQTDTTSYGFSHSVKTRNGATVSKSISLNRSVDNAIVNPSDANTATVKFNVEIPLSKGKGEEVNTASERAAMAMLERERSQYLHTVSETIMNTVNAYWNYLAAYKRLEILNDSEKKAVLLLEETQKLVKAGEVPAAELNQLTANAAEKKASRIEGENALYTARYALGDILGIPLSEIEKLGVPDTDFPVCNSCGTFSEKSYEVFMKHALGRRADYHALKKLCEASGIVYKESLDLLNPDYRVEFSAGYSGLAEGKEYSRYFSAFNHEVSGLNLSARLNYYWPQKAIARASIAQKDASLKQAEINLWNLERSIGAAVRISVSDLFSGLKRLEQAQQSVDLYKKAIDSEQKKFRLGMSTLIDVINLEDRLTSALISRISAQRTFAGGIIKLRFEMGEIGKIQEGQSIVSLDDLITYPAAFVQ